MSKQSQARQEGVLTNRARQRIARRAQGQSRSVMGDIMRKAAELTRQGKPIVNLGAGVPDYPAPDFLKEAGANAILTGNNSYGDSRGLIELRVATANRFAHSNGLLFDAEQEVTITAGASAALSAALLAVVNPGDRVIVFEPYFENFIPLIQAAGGVPKVVALHEDDFAWNERELAAAFSKRTAAVLLNTPHNPSGRVFSEAELEALAVQCRKHDVVVISDETYEPFVYGGKRHVSIATLPGMFERTITIGSISKVFNVSGWRVGDLLASRELTAAVRRMNDLALGAPVPLQAACVEALTRYEEFVAQVVDQHEPLRDSLENALAGAGFKVFPAQGTFSLLADSSPLGFTDAGQAADFLLSELGIIAVPATSFYRQGLATTNLRFCFARTASTIAQATELLTRLSPEATL